MKIRIGNFFEFEIGPEYLVLSLIVVGVFTTLSILVTKMIQV